MKSKLDNNIESAKKIILALSVLSLSVLYILLFGNITLKNDLITLKNERNSLRVLKTKSDTILSEIRNFYNGSTNDKKYNFTSYIYAVDISEFELNTILSSVELYNLKPEDKEYLILTSNLLKNNIYELKTVLKGLIDEKNKRIPFDELPLFDLKDLDYHKEKDAWRIQRSVYYLGQALFNQKLKSKAFLTQTKTLKDTYDFLIEKYNKQNKSPQTIPLAAGRNKKVTAFLKILNEKGFRTINELKNEIFKTNERIDEIQKEIDVAIKMPVINLSIRQTSLSWIISLFNVIILMFLIFYIGKINSLLKDTKNIEHIKDELISYPWIFVNDKKLSKYTQNIRLFLKYSLLILPLLTGFISIIMALKMNIVEWLLSIFLYLLSIFLMLLAIKEINSMNNL